MFTQSFALPHKMYNLLKKICEQILVYINFQLRFKSLHINIVSDNRLAK